MKLIDILVEELPKRGGWPKSANCITQDGDLKVEPAYCHPSVAKCGDDGFWFLDSSRIGGFEVDTLASDYTTAIITREQYEAALAAKNDGWIDWGGGDCPVDSREMVDVIFGHGGRMSANIAECWRWSHDGTDSDIIAYRLHQPQEAEQARADAWNAYAGVTEPDDEVDLNECIGQAPATEWNGEGLPPVGCECEFMKHTLDSTPNWRRGIIKYVSEYTVVIVEALSPGEFVAHPHTCDFRPIRSEADIKRHDAAQALCYAGGGIGKVDESAGIGSCWFDVYDAIAAGKIPGVKLED